MARKFRDLCKINRLELLLFKVYVDDENQLWRIMERGRRWNGQRMEWRRDWKSDDDEKNECSDVRMMREVRKMANSIESDIQLTVDVPSENVDKKLPVLDLKMWVEGRELENGGSYEVVMHEFYEKQMVTPRVISRDSALPERVKRETLAQEIIRISKNTHECLRKERREKTYDAIYLEVIFVWYLFPTGG